MMKSESIVLLTLGPLVLAVATGCASTPQQYRLDCRGTVAQRFAECGTVFDTFTECKAAQQRMIREPGLRARDRGTCLKGHDR